MNSERGNIIVYLLIGLVMFGAVAGSLWWLQTRAGDEQQPASTSEEREADNDQAPAEQPAADPAPANGGDTAPSDTEPAGRAPAADTPATASPTNDQPVTTSDATTPPAQPTPTQVAPAGPVENSMLMAASLGMIAFAATSYARSRRSL